jgi:hypothetical protein
MMLGRILAPRVSLAAAALVFAAACGASPDQPRDDAATWQLDSTPFVDIGGRHDDTLVMLARPHSAALLHDSLVVVGDYGIPELRVFNLAGDFVRAIGRAGEGPGEFRGVFKLHHCGDSLHVYDSRAQTYLVFGADGGFARQYRATGPDRLLVVIPFAAACNRNGQFIKHSYWRAQSEVPTTMRPDVVLWLAAAEGAVTADLGDFPGPDLHVHRGNSRPVPMGRETLIAIGADRAYVGTADSAVIHTYRLDGTLLSTINVPYEARPATEPDREWFKRVDTLGREASWVRTQRAFWAEVSFPERIPSYTALLVDADDLLWVRGYPADSSLQVRWTAMSATGQVIGSADLPANLEVTEIGSDHVLGLQGDPVSGLRRIRGFRLHR